MNIVDPTEGASTPPRSAQSTEIDRIGRQVADAYRAGLADARRQVMGWADEQMQALPEFRTPVAHGKAELLTDLRGFVAIRAEQTAARSTRPDKPCGCKGPCNCDLFEPLNQPTSSTAERPGVDA